MALPRRRNRAFRRRFKCITSDIGLPSWQPICVGTKHKPNSFYMNERKSLDHRIVI
jgi:hypothetical protein